MNWEEGHCCVGDCDVCRTPVRDVTLAEDAVGITVSGWCAPSELIYDISHDAGYLALPPIHILRPGTPEYEAHQHDMEVRRLTEETMQQRVARMIGRHVNAIRWLQDRDLIAAYRWADANGYDVVLQEPAYDHQMWRWDQAKNTGAAYRHIGIGFCERSTELWRTLQGDRPIIIRERAASDYEWDD